MSKPDTPDEPLKPWERLVTGMDLGSEDSDCMVIAVYNEITGKLRIVDIEQLPDSGDGK